MKPLDRSRTGIAIALLIPGLFVALLILGRFAPNGHRAGIEGSSDMSGVEVLRGREARLRLCAAFEGRIAQSRNPEHLYVSWAIQLLLLGEWDAAAAKCEQASKVDPGPPRAHLVRGFARFAQGRFDEARRAFGRLPDRTVRTLLLRATDHATSAADGGDALGPPGLEGLARALAPDARSAFLRVLDELERAGSGHALSREAADVALVRDLAYDSIDAPGSDLDPDRISSLLDIYLWEAGVAHLFDTECISSSYQEDYASLVRSIAATTGVSWHRSKSSASREISGRPAKPRTVPRSASASANSGWSGSCRRSTTGRTSTGCSNS